MSRKFIIKSLVFVAGISSAFPLMIAFSSAAQDGDERVDVDAEQRLQELGIELPAPSKSLAIYKKIVVVDKMAYLSGHIPIDEQGEIMQGKLGRDVDVEAAAKAAQRCAIGLLATLRGEVGSLNNVRRLVKTTGMVNSLPDETQQPEVINGCSQLIVDIFGEENGKGARAAVGMASLPRGAICEIEMIFELK
jgi:enamine deaminase RidA (YjgF/YER057c/UK114 family)